MSSAIPKPSFPSRPRCSSIAQAAASESAAPPAAPPAVTPEPPAPRAATAQPAPAAATSNPKRLGGVTTDILLTIPVEEKERLVNSMTWTAPHTGIKHQSKFIRYAITKLCEDLENRFNNGEPFSPPAIPAV